MRYWYKPIAVILSINLVIPQVNVEKSEQKTGLVNVAYVGESMENIPESYQKLVLYPLVNHDYKLMANLSL